MNSKQKLILMDAKEYVILHSDNTDEILLVSIKNKSFEFHLYENMDLDFLCFKVFSLANTPNKQQRCVKFNNSILLRATADIACHEPIRIIVKAGKFDIQAINELERDEMPEAELTMLNTIMSGKATKLAKSSLVEIVQGEKYDYNKPFNF